MRFYDCLSIFEVENEHKTGPSDSVEEASANQGPASVGVGQILVHHQEAVSEVEISFERILRGERTAPEVVDGCLGHAREPIAFKPQTPAEVDFFHVGEKVFIEASCFKI